MTTNMRVKWRDPHFFIPCLALLRVVAMLVMIVGWFALLAFAPD